MMLPSLNLLGFQLGSRTIRAAGSVAKTSHGKNNKALFLIKLAFMPSYVFSHQVRRQVDASTHGMIGRSAS